MTLFIAGGGAAGAPGPRQPGPAEREPADGAAPRRGAPAHADRAAPGERGGRIPMNIIIKYYY